MVNASPSLLPPVAPRPAQVGLLADIAAGLAGGSDLADLLAQFLAPIVRLAGAQAGTVRALSAAGDRLELVGTFGLASQSCSGGKAADSHCGACGAAAHGQPIVWIGDPDHSADAATADMPAGGCRHVLAVPLRHRGRTLGVYTLFFQGDQEPSPQVKALLQTVGELLGLALNNARLEQKHLQATLLRERQHMAADVHDSLAQSLTFVKMRMPLLQDAMLAHDDALGQRYYEDVRGAITQAHASVRAIVSQLRVPVDPEGLLHALGRAADGFRSSSGTELRFENHLSALDLPAEQQTQVFHILQEALSNVARHAGAEHAWLRIDQTADGDIRFEVEDDGNGLPARASDTTHYGLDIMQERARRIGARFEIGRGDALRGTRVRLTLPSPGGPGARP
jgi:two-component system nitrate/nitrite sensor histidine kinase NarX